MVKRALVNRILGFRGFSGNLDVSKSIKHHKAFVPPRLVEIIVTNSCNLRCAMCDRWKWIKENNSTSKTLSTQRLSELIAELADFGVKDILLSGGEPMIRPDFKSIVEEISASKMGVSMFTNGTLLNRENAEAIAAANATVFLSLDGASETHDKIRGVRGTFDRAIQGIEYLANAKRESRSKNRTIINFTVQRSNVDDVAAIFGVADKKGADLVAYNLVHGKPEVAPDERDVDTLRKGFETISRLAASSGTRYIIGDMVQALIEDKISLQDVRAGIPAFSLFKNSPVPCLAAYKTSFIDTLGRVYPCCFCYMDNSPYNESEKMRNRFCMGSIHETGFREIWYGTKYDKFRVETDPVDINDLRYFCGQCYDYFAFRKQGRPTGLLQKN